MGFWFIGWEEGGRRGEGGGSQVQRTTLNFWSHVKSPLWTSWFPVPVTRILTAMKLRRMPCVPFELVFFQTKGELTQERRESYEAAYNAFHKLHSNAAALAVSWDLWARVKRAFVLVSLIWWMLNYHEGVLSDRSFSRCGYAVKETWFWWM